MKKAPVMVGIGEALWDVFGEESHFGGAPANFCLHAVALLGSSHLVSSFGDDELGKKSLRTLAERGVDTSHVQTHPSRATGQVYITHNQEAEPQFEFMAQPAWDEIFSSPAQLELARNCDAVDFGTLAQQSPQSIATTQRFLKNCPPESIRLFDLNLRRNFWSPELILASLPLASAVKCNEHEVTVLAQATGLSGDNPEAVLKAVRERYQLQFAVLTLGAQGSLIVTESEESWQQAPTVQALDTTGAGDSFIATLISGLLKGLPLAAVHPHASRISAYVCSQEGATPTIPSEFTKFLNAT